MRSPAPWLLCRSWAGALRDLGFEVAAVGGVGPVDGASGEVAGATVSRRIPSQVRREVAAARSDLAAVRRGRRARRELHAPSGQVELVWQYHFRFFDAGIQLARSIGCPSFLMVDAPQVWEARQWGVRRPGWGSAVERWGERSIMRAATLVGVVSDEAGEHVQSMGVDPAQIIKVPNGASVDWATSSPGDMRREVGLDPGTRVIGWIGGFQRFHGLDVLVDAYRALSRGDEQLALLLVGDGPERARIAARVEELGLVGVHFAGRVEHEAIPRWIRTMDVAVVGAAPDGGFHYSPMKAVEYLACGVPVVAPDVGEVHRTMAGAVRLYDRHRPDGLEQGIRSLLDSEADRRRLAEAGLELVRQQFDPLQQAERVLAEVGL